MVEKYILPNAMNCGCSYELFWKLNPRKLESFYEAQRIKVDNELETQNLYAWLYGSYVLEAIAANFSKGHSYPQRARDLKNHREDELEPPPGESMSDGQRFYLFMLEHNKAMEKKRRRKKREE